MSVLPKALLSFVFEFDRQWSRGNQPAIEDFLRGAGEQAGVAPNGPMRREFLFRLIAVDIERQWQQEKPAGSRAKPPLLEQYAKRFPELGPTKSLPVKLIQREFIARFRAKRNLPALEEYVERFPDYPQLKELLEKAAKDAVKSGKVAPPVDGYRIVTRLGGGAFGEVYLAVDSGLKRRVAIKFLRTGSTRDDAEHLLRFRNEAIAIAKIDHPNVIRVLRVSTSGTRPYMILEYAAGGTLRSRMKEWNQARATDPWQWQRKAATILRDLAFGLAAAHAQDIIHRDLKPENILFDLEAKPKIADFGVARIGDGLLTKSRQPGTLEYMSPEQLKGDVEITPQSDVYSLGVILFELLTGRRPFRSEEGEPDGDPNNDAPSPRQFRPEIHIDLETICERCLQIERRYRFPKAIELAQDLDLFLQGQPIKSRPLSRRERVEKFLTRHRFRLGAAVLIFIAAILGVMAYDQSQVAKTAQVETKQLKADLQVNEEQIAAQISEIDNQKATARASKIESVASREEKELHAYAADMQAVQDAWGRGNVKLAKEIVNRHDPQLNGGSSDWRGFEWHYWKHLLRGQGVFNNGNRCRSVTVDKQGKHLAATDFENVTVWNLETNAQEHRWPINVQPNGDPIRFRRDLVSDDSVAFSSDGKYLAATGYVKTERGRFGTLRVWNMKTGKEILLIADDQGLSGQAVTFSPESKQVIAGDIPRGWKSWYLESGQVAHQGQRLKAFAEGVSRESDEGSVTSLVFGRNAQTLFSTCYPKSAVARFWPSGNIDSVLRTRYPPRAPDRHEFNRSVYGAYLSIDNDGHPTLAGLDNFGQAYLYASRRPEDEVQQVYEIAIPAPTMLRCLSWNDPHLLAGGEDGIVYLFECMNILGKVNVKQTILRGHETPLACVAMGPNNLPISADEGGTIRIWTAMDAETVPLTSKKYCMTAKFDAASKGITLSGHSGEPIGHIPLEKKMGVTIWASPGERFALIGLSEEALLSRYILWNCESRKAIVDRACRYISSMSHVAFSDGSSRGAITTAGYLLTVVLCDTGSVIREVDVNGVSKFTLSRSGRFLAASGPISVQLWDLDSGEAGRSLALESFEPALRACVFSSDEKRLILDSDPCVVWNVESGERLPATAENSLAEPKAATSGIQRLYRVKSSPEQLQIMCGRTFRELLTANVRWRSPYAGAVGNHAEARVIRPIPGTNGFAAMDVMDKRLKDVVADWEKSGGDSPDSAEASERIERAPSPGAIGVRRR